MKLIWDELTRERYEESKGRLQEIVDDCIGFIRIGEICVDVLIRSYEGSYEDEKFVYSYDFYIANEDTGYGYRDLENGETVAYDYADGTDLFDLTLSYDDFVRESERIIEDFITKNDKKFGYSLIEKANRKLVIW